ncbi:hypothetical protein T08_6181 [Trichinella sp. T8]|uniref:Uncharacterized protein n=1 Tax=Trichinella murrelli TaxID=144512 RepID=A0A0V0UD34_9BILA|nr:hypothetical protein T05_6065 [Trichinella murrelli]KRZ90268.1 hypothetical protein T08_6181 [Trichinella sp. T8]
MCKSVPVNRPACSACIDFSAVTSCTHISMSDVFNFHLAILGGLWRQFVRARPNQGRLQQLLSACLCIFNTHIHKSYIGACLDGLSGSREQLFPAHGAARLREKQCELWKPCCAISAEEVICLDALALAGADLLLLLFNIDFIDNLKSIESEEQRPNIYIRGAPISSLKAGRVRTAKKRAAQTYMIIRSLRRPILPPITLDVGCSLLTNCAEQAGKQAARLNH